MTSLANITILFLLNTFEVESKRINIDFIGCYMRSDVLRSDHSTNRLYYPVNRSKTKQCQCRHNQWCKIGLSYGRGGRKARVTSTEPYTFMPPQISDTGSQITDFDDESPNDTLLPPLPPVTTHQIVVDQNFPKISCNGKLYLNGRKYDGEALSSGLYECWFDSTLLRQDYVTVIKSKRKNKPDKSRCPGSSLVCFNGGECVRGARSLKRPICQCRNGFTGVNCNQRTLSFDLK